MSKAPPESALTLRAAAITCRVRGETGNGSVDWWRLKREISESGSQVDISAFTWASRSVIATARAAYSSLDSEGTATFTRKVVPMVSPARSKTGPGRSAQTSRWSVAALSATAAIASRTMARRVSPLFTSGAPISSFV